MEEINLKPGDKVYHLSLSSVTWVVEKVEDDSVYCSTLMKETLEHKKEKFAITSVKKIMNKPNVRVTPVGINRNNYF